MNRYNKPVNGPFLEHCSWTFMVGPYLPLWPFLDNGRSAIWLYGHKYGQVGCLFKDMEKCRSPVKKLN